MKKLIPSGPFGTLRVISDPSSPLLRKGFLLLLVTLGLLIAARLNAPALEIGVAGPSGQYWERMTNVYNPNGISGLLRVASLSGDYSFTGIIPPGAYWSGQAGYGVAVSGSDAFIDPTRHPALPNTALEPMADAHAEAVTTGARVVSWAVGEIEVNHRVIARAFPPELKDQLEPLSKIPVKLHLKLHVSVQGGPDRWYDSYAKAGCTLWPGQVGTVFWADLAVRSSSGPQSLETNRTLSLTIDRHRTNDIHTYSVEASVDIRAETYYNGIPAKAQAVADPLLEVDPDWEYAPYFVVVQESINRPGEWIELTRQWTNTIVQPALNLSHSNSNIMLSWPASAGEFDLQVTTNLEPPILWSHDTNAPVLATNAHWQVMPPAPPGEQRFYRLLSR
jgi:hypothetical protein